MVIKITEKDLFEQVKGIMNKPHKLTKRGSGAPGMLLEELLGIESNSRDIPDAGKWELKYHGGKSLLTLFHKNPASGTAGIKELIDHYGWVGKDGRQAFRKTFSGSKDEFMILDDGEDLVVSSNKVTLKWNHDVLMNSASGKIQNLVLVSGSTKAGEVTYESAVAYSEFSISKFIPEVITGVVKIDFDARYKTHDKDSKIIRDHGTKFRVAIKDLDKLYKKSVQIYP